MRWVYYVAALAIVAVGQSFRQAPKDPRRLDQVLADAQPTIQYLNEEIYERPKLEAELPAGPEDCRGKNTER